MHYNLSSVRPRRQFIRDLGLLTAEVPGLEADDCIGTLTARGVREGFEVTIASGDKDLEQLIALAPDRVRMLKPGLRGGVTPYGVEEFRKKYDSKCSTLSLFENQRRRDWVAPS